MRRWLLLRIQARGSERLARLGVERMGQISAGRWAELASKASERGMGLGTE